MNFLKRVWWLCLLVIAGAGPLPLWLHHTLHHATGHHSSGHHPGHTDGPGATHAHSHAHSHAHTTGCDHSSVFAERAARAVNKPGVLSGTDTHEDCVTCYLLSQASTHYTFELTISSQPLASPAGRLSDELPWANLILAYSTRGPPVC